MSEPTLDRRDFLEGAAWFAGALLLPVRFAAAQDAFALSGAAKAAIESSPLIYVSPIRSDGAESSCQAEVWFAGADSALFIVTSSEGWKAKAVQQGLDARIWVGDFGPWKKSDAKYKSAPSFRASASVVQRSDVETVERVLAVMGKKYSDGWAKWEPRFRQGLADGTRVMLRYRPIAA